MFHKWSRVRGIALVIGVVVCATPARAVVYAGAPDLALTVRFITTGSESDGFHARTLFARAFGVKWPKEEARLRQRYSAQRVRDCEALLDYAIADAVRVVKRDGVALPPAQAGAQPLPVALWTAGLTPSGRYDVGYMLERLITHPYHHEIMRDLDARFGPRINASFHIVLASIVEDAHRLATAPVKSPKP